MSVGGGGVNTTDVKWAVGELEWSTLMIVLDKAVSHPFLREKNPTSIRFVGLSYRLHLP